MVVLRNGLTVRGKVNGIGNCTKCSKLMSRDLNGASNIWFVHRFMYHFRSSEILGDNAWAEERPPHLTRGNAERLHSFIF